eukprot:GHVS01074641.1.p2 GENE.GHVS01074641.1~~GHVS01074641.1.p2  ORF type:complete len:151 (+),score=40.95 GHVS01074641.1:157-609(+)
MAGFWERHFCLLFSLLLLLLLFCLLHVSSAHHHHHHAIGDIPSSSSSSRRLSSSEPHQIYSSSSSSWIAKKGVAPPPPRVLEAPSELPAWPTALVDSLRAGAGIFTAPSLKFLKIITTLALIQGEFLRQAPPTPPDSAPQVDDLVAVQSK